MKITFALAALAVTEAHVVDMMNLQTGVEGPPVHMWGTPLNNWRHKWPQGLDDSTDDENIMNWPRDPKKKNPPIQYHDKMRQWVPGTWPVNFSWNPQMDKATYHNQIDDGSDDNESVDVMTASKGI